MLLGTIDVDLVAMENVNAILIALETFKNNVRLLDQKCSITRATAKESG